MRYLIPLIIFCFSLGLSSCEFANEEDLYPEPGPCSDLSAVSYSADVVPILETRCYSCHAVGSNSGGIIFDDFTKITPIVTNGTLIGVIQFTNSPKNMPTSGKMDSCTIAILEAWVDQGGLDN